MSANNSMNDKSAGELIELITGSLNDLNDNGAIKNRAIAFINALTPPLVYLRDHEGADFSVQSYKEGFELTSLEALAFNESQNDEKAAVVKPLVVFLESLPFYDRKKIGHQSEYTNQQYGFVAKMVARALNGLSPV